jgi:hypothetical protein
LAFHIAASQRLGQGVANAEPFLDPWVSEWSLGFPVWRIYQPVPHLVAASVMRACRGFASPSATFAALYYLLLVLLPASLYLGARLMGLGPLAAGFAAVLIMSASGGGDFGRYGLSYGAFVWRGSGLFTELFALEVMLPTLGLVARSIDSGQGQTGAALGLTLTSLSHIFFGYVAFVSAAVWALVAAEGERPKRVVRALSIAGRALLLLAWFLVPMALVSSEVNRSRWDPAYKFDSYGARVILNELFSGRLLDFGRFPVLSLLIAVGALTAIFKIRELTPRRLLLVACVWLALFFGRETWGYLMIAAGIPSQFHLHRLEVAFELFAILLAGWGLERIVSSSIRTPGLVTIAVGSLLGAAVLTLALDRAEFLRLNRTWGEATLAQFRAQRGDLEASLEDVRKVINRRPGRVSAGKAAEWGGTFKIGEANVYSFLSSYGFDEASYLYHTMSLSSDYMVLREENNLVHQDFFGIRAVLAPTGMNFPAFFQKRAVHGRFTVYEVSPEGYFGLVDIGARYEGPPTKWFEPATQWLRSWMARGGEVIAANAGSLAGVPLIGRWQQLPDPALQFMRPRGRILAESKVDEVYRATIDAARSCYGLIKITYFPGLVVRVDGKREPLIRVFPDFGAFSLGAGHHEVEVSYSPGPLKPLLFIGGLVLFVLVSLPSVSETREWAASWLEKQFEVLGEWLTTDRVKTALALLLLILLFTRALFRGALVDGHDSLAYPARLTEFAKLVQERQFPPLWGPDLGAGHGQPLFEFASPLVYAAALPFLKCGMGLADSLEFGLAFLFAIGAIAVYQVGRKMSFPRFAALGGAAAWLFAPYQALDVFVSVRFAEASALAMAPLGLLGVMTVLQRPTALNIALAAGAVALVILAHNAVALLLLPIFAALVLARSAVSAHRLKTAATGAAALAGGIGLSAFFWLPALLEKNFVKVDRLRTGVFDWRIHIISWWQLFWGHWGFGYSVAGSGDGISFELGWVHLALAALGILIAVRASNRERRVDALVFAGATIAAALLATGWTSKVWEHVTTLQYLQFPWRTLIVPALFMPLLAVFAFEWLSPKGTVAMIALMVLVNFVHTEPKGYQTFDDEYFAPAMIAKTGYETTTRTEYEPRWVEVHLGYMGNGLVNPPSTVSLRTLSWTSTRHEYSVAASATTHVMDSTYYYPGWAVFVDGRETPVTPAPTFGMIAFTIPAGNHVVVVEFRRTPIRCFGLLISLVTIASLLSASLIAQPGVIRRIRRTAQRSGLDEKNLTPPCRPADNERSKLVVG